MKTVFKYLKNIPLYIFLALSTTIVLPILLVLSLFPERIRYDNRVYYFISSLWMSFIIKVSGIKLTVRGKEYLSLYPDDPSIIISNHTSAFDIPCLEMLVGSYPHVWVSKAGYRRLPLWGMLLKRMHVSVERDDVRKTLSAMKRILKLIQGKQRHLLIFPEGTRHSDGKLHHFYDGFALLAKKLERPVIPIVIVGLHKIFPRRSFLIDSSACVVKISIGAPMYYSKDLSREQFIHNVHAWCEQEIKRLTS